MLCFHYKVKSLEVDPTKCAVEGPGLAGTTQTSVSSMEKQLGMIPEISVRKYSRGIIGDEPS